GPAAERSLEIAPRRFDRAEQYSQRAQSLRPRSPLVPGQTYRSGGLARAHHGISGILGSQSISSRIGRAFAPRLKPAHSSAPLGSRPTVNWVFSRTDSARLTGRPMKRVTVVARQKL